MEDKIRLKIITPEKEVFKGEITLLNTENEFGKFEILPNHIAMVSSLVPTATSIKTKDGKSLVIFTSSGVLRVYENNIELMCEAAEWPKDIDINEAEELMKKAEASMFSKNENERQKAKLEIREAAARIKVKNNADK